MRSKETFRRIAVVSTLIVAVAGPAIAQVETALVAAEGYLAGTQNADGSFGTLPSLAPRDSALAVLALIGGVSPEPAVTQGAVYLQGVPEANTSFRSRRALALAETGHGFEALLDSLSEFKNGGGFGAFATHESNLLDTALAVEALSLSEGARLLDIATLLDYLQLHQSADGGWGFAPGSPSEVYFTAEVVRILSGLEQLAVGAGVLGSASDFLLARQQADGGFGNVLETAMAYRALVAAGRGADLPFGSPVPYLLAAQHGDGSWESDPFTTAQVVLALRGQRPNLVVAALEAPDSSPGGLPIALTVTLKNVGPEPAPASHLEVRYETEDGVLAAEAPVPALEAGEETVVVLEVTTEGFADTLVLFAVADARDEVTEAEEGDNAASATVTLRAGADLALFPSDLSVVPETPEPGVEFNLLIEARNLGETEVASFGYRVTRVDVSGPGEELAAGTGGPVAPGAAFLLTVPLTLAEGEHTVEVELDPAGEVDEENESNNLATLGFFVVDPSQPDLALSDADLVLTPAAPDPGGTVDVAVTLHNEGSRDATAVLELWENGLSGTPLRTWTLDVAAGSAVTVNETVTVGLGAYSLLAVADPGQEVLETDESNNRVERFFRDLPDLALGFDNLEVLTPEPLAGDPVEVQVTVRNAGTAPAQNVLLEVYEGDPSAGGAVVFSETFPEIPASGNRGTGFTWTAAAGANVLVAIADGGDAILEFSETNNRAEREVAVPRPTGPDLVIAAVDRTGLTDSAATREVSGSVAVDVTNAGDGDVTSPFEVRLFEDANGDGRHSPGEKLLGSAVVTDPLAAGSTVTVSVAVSATVSFHHPLAWVKVDAGDAIAEQRESNNAATLYGDCELPAPPAPGFEGVEEEWYLPGVEVETAPIVVQLSDDNGDGAIDSRDVPDVVFHTVDAEGRALMAVSGLDGTELWAFRSTPANPLVIQLGQVAAADLDGDGVAEVIGHQRDGRLFALDHAGNLLWVSEKVEGVGDRGLGGPSVGDLNGDGVPEIVFGRTVLSNTGELIALGTSNRGQNYNYYGLLGTVLVPGASAYPQSVIADIDLDGVNEIVAGDAVYRLNGDTLEVVWDATVPDKLMVDGFSAVANLDADPEAEIVYVSSGQILVMNHDGSTFAGRRVMVPFSIFEVPTYWGSAPTIANLDGTGAPEILVSTATRLIAYRANLGKMWERSIGPDFGGVTGVTAFDFNGDGASEVLFNDERTFYVLNGLNGSVLYSHLNTSKTAMEYPVVADVDGDGRAEVVLGSNQAGNGDTSTQGLHVLGHPGWRGTRPVWNQYGYHVTNVALDGTVPSPQVAPWQADNLFRSNRGLEPPARLLLPDVSVSFPRVGAAGAAGVPVTVRVGNGGRGAVAAGVAVELFEGSVAGDPVLTGATSRGLRPGEWEDVTLLWTAPSAGDIAVVAVVDRPDRLAECDEDDNRVAFTLTETLLPDLAIAAGGVSAVSPVPAGQVVDVTISVDNVGNAEAPPSRVRLFDGAPPTGQVLGEVSVPPLAAGASADVIFSWDTLGTGGLRLVYALVDPDGDVLEHGVDNNLGLVQIELQLPAGADLVLESLEATPAAVDAGNPALLRATVRNRGADLEGGFEVLFRANNATLGRASTPGTLAHGESVSLELEMNTTSYGGDVALTAVADPDNLVAEENELNNEATASLTVRQRTVDVTVATDKLAYAPRETVEIQVTIQNTGTSPRDLVGTVSLVDSLGVLVATIAEPAVTLAAGETTTLDLTTDTGDNLPGTYSIVAELSDAGSVAGRGSALLTIGKLVSAEASLFADRDVYTPLQAAILRGTVSNTSPNTTLYGAIARLTVTAAGGGEVFASEQALLALYPSSTASVNGTWEIANAAPGAYSASLALRDALGQLVAYVETPIAVESSGETGAGLEGRISVLPDEVAAGAPFVVDFEVANLGNADAADLIARFDLVRTSDGETVDVQRLPLVLARGESFAGSVGFPTQGLAEGGYLVSLVAVAPARETRLDRVGLTVVPGVSVFDATIEEGDAGSHELVFQVRLSSPREVPVTVEFATADGSATAGNDYAAASGELTFDAGELDGSVAVTVFGDVDPESEEVFVLTLSNASGIEIGDGQALGVLLDEEGCASPNLLTNGDAEESAPDGTLTGWPLASGSSGGGFERCFAVPSPLSGAAYLGVVPGVAEAELGQEVDLTPYAAVIDAGLPIFVLDGFVQTGATSSARLAVDYLDGSGTVLETYDSGEIVAAAGWTSLAQQRSVPVGTRHAVVRLFATEATGGGAAVFFDRLALHSAGVVTLSLDDTEVFEGDTGAVTAQLALRLSCPQPADLPVYIATADETARAGADYNAVSETITVPAGQTLLDVGVTVGGDTLDEADETFLVAPVTGEAVVLDTVATVTILDDDGPVAVSIDDVAAVEGTGEASLVVHLSAPSGKTVSVAYQSENGTAGAADYQAVSGRLSFEPGETEALVVVPLVDDQLDEPDEAFDVVLDAPTFATLLDGRATVTLLDDDVVTFTVDDVHVVEGDPSETSNVVAEAVFTVRTSLPSVFTTGVSYATADGVGTEAAVVDEDYLATSGSFTFAPGELSATVAVPIVADLFREPLETFRLMLSSPTGGVLGDPEGIGSIVDDDGILISVGDAQAVEPPGHPINLSRTDGVLPTPSSNWVNDSNRGRSAMDGRLDTSWHSAAGDAVGYGTSPYFELTFPAPVRVVGLRLFGNRSYANGYDYLAGYFTLYDVDGAVLWDSGVLDLPAPDRDIVLDFPEVAGVRRARFSSTADESDHPGLSEFEVVGFDEAINLSRAEGTVANASSTYSSSYPVTRGIDGSLNTSWFPAIGDSVNHGGAPWFEVVFPDRATVHEIRFFGNRQYANGYDYFAGIFQVFDDSGAVLWDSGVVDLPDPTRDVTLIVPAVPGARRVRFSGTANESDHPGFAELEVWGSFEGSSAVLVPVTLSKAPITEVGVSFATADGEAIAGEDYEAATGSLLFPPGATRRDVGLNLLPDDLEEVDERFLLELTDPIEGILLDAEGEVTILDEDSVVLLGDAEDLSIPGCVVLTPDAQYRRGAAWSKLPLDLSQSFDKTFQVHLGTRNHGEGMYFVLQRAGLSALGASLGYSGIEPSVGVELDTRASGGDELSIDFDGLEQQGTPVVDLKPGQSDLADGTEHELRVVWNAARLELNVYFDGERRLVQEQDLVTEVFDGDPLAYWGLTAETSGSYNLQYACPADGWCKPGVTPTASVGDVTVLEGSPGGNPVVMSFPVTLSCPSDEPVTVEYTTADGTAHAGSDFAAAAGELTFLPGETAKQVEVAVTSDLDWELTETFSLELVAANGAGLSHSEGLGTIEADDWGSAITQSVLIEGELNRSYYPMLVDLFVVPTETVRLRYTISGGTATAGQDFRAINNGTLTFSAGQRLATLRLDVIGDTLLEGDETIHIDFWSDTGLIEPNQVTLTLLDDDECPSPNLIENPGADLVVDGELPGWTEALGDLWTGDQRVGRITQPYHFFPGRGPVDLAELYQDVDVSSYATAIDAGDQLFVFQGHVYAGVPDSTRIVLEYRNASGAVLGSFDTGEISHNLGYWRAVGDRRAAPAGTRSVRVRLIGTDYNGNWNEAYFDALTLRTLRYPSAILDDAAAEEGAVGDRALVMPVHLTCASERTAEVSFVTLDGTAVAGADYRATTGTVTFPPGTLDGTLSVPMIGDTVAEGDETFVVRLFSSVETGIGDGEAVATIVDDESRISIGDVSIVETSEGRVDAIFPVTVDRPSDAQISVYYTTEDGTATANEDYVPVEAKVKFYPGTTETTARVEVIGDTDEEPDETFVVRLFDPNNAEIADGEALGTIIQDDIAISIANATVLEGNVATTFVTFDVTLSLPSSTVVTVDWATSDATAVAGEDYEASSGTVSFQPGETRKTFPVTVYGDELREGSETFFVRLSNPKNAMVRIAEAIAILIDDDDCPSPNLLLNPSAEIPLANGDVPFWAEIGNQNWTRGTSSPLPADGNAYFATSGSTSLELGQDVSVEAFAAYIDAGLQRFSFEGFIRSRVETYPDAGRIVVSYLDADGTLIEQLDSGEIVSPNVWQPFGDLRLAPAGTRTIRVRLYATRSGTSGNIEVYFDGLGLRSVGTPVLLPSDAEVEEGDEAPVDMTFAVDLLCPSDERTITLDYATQDRSAVAGSDYEAVAGSITYLPGEQKKTVTVTTTGDFKREVSETFFLEFSNVVNAVVLYPRVTGTLTDDDPGNTPVPRPIGSNVVYTLDEDFELGFPVSVQHDDPADDQLQLSKVGSTFPFMWIAASARGTIVKIDTRSGEILGEFRTAPNGIGRDPSRTTVTLDGSVWVGNRAGQSVAHLGLVELNQCVDRNGNGVIDTSTGYDDILPWPNTDNQDTQGGVTTAEDECILHFVRTSATGTRHISIRDENSIWVSGTGNGRHFDLIDTRTGEILYTEPGVNCGGYGGLTDRNGVVWSSTWGSVLRWDPSVVPATAESKRCLSVPGAYGLAIDSKGWVWATNFGNAVRKVSPDGNTVLGPFLHGASSSRGLVVDGNDDVWVSSTSGGTTVGHLKNDGSYVGRVYGVPEGSTGVAIDSRGYVWTANLGSSTASRIDPLKGPIGPDGVTPIGEVDLVVDMPRSGPYNYSDMTGFVALQATSPRGTWAVIQDSLVDDTEWGTIYWNTEPQAYVPEGASIVVEVRASNTVPGLSVAEWLAIENGVSFQIFGRYMQIRVTLRPNEAGESPVLSDLGIVPEKEGEVSVSDATVVEGNGPETTKAVFTVSLTEATTREVVAKFTTVDGSALAGVDYVAQSGTVFFNAGEIEKTITIEVIGDLDVEDDESFSVVLSDLFNGVFLDDTGQGSILDDDAFAALTVTKTDALTGDLAGDGDANPGDRVGYTITLTSAGTLPVTGVVLSDAAPAHTSVVAGSVTASQGTVTSESPVAVDLGEIAAGTAVTVTFEVAIDALLPEGVEQISNQASVTSAELGETLSDDPEAPGDADPTVTPVFGVPELAATKTDDLVDDADADGVVSPGDTIRYTLTVSNTGNAAASAVRVRDLIPEHTVLVAGSVTASLGDIVTEEPVEVDVGLLAAGASAVVTFDAVIVRPFPLGVDTVTNQGTVTSDQLPAVLSDDPDVAGDADPTVTQVTAAPRLMAKKTDALAADNDGDGVPSPGDEIEYTVTLQNLGSTTATGVYFFDLVPEHTTIVADSVTTSAGSVVGEDPVEVDAGQLDVGAEVTVAFRVAVVNPIPAGVAEIANQGAVAADGLDDVLTDDPDAGGDADPTVTVITAAPVLVVEKSDTLFTDAGGDSVASPGDELLYTILVKNTGNTGATGVALTDTLDANLTLVPGTVQTSHGTVVSEDPLEVEVGTVGVADPVTVTFRVTVADPFPWEETAVTNQAVVTSAELDPVPSDDPDTEPAGDPTATEVFLTPEVSVDNVTVNEGDGTADFTVSLAEPGNRPVTVSYATADGEAQAGADYESASGEITLAPGETTATVPVTIVSDLIDEPDETFTLTLTAADGGVLGDAEGVGTILDDDDPPLVSITGVTVTEGDTGRTDAFFAVTLSGPSGFDVTVSYQSAEGTALAGVDYETTAGAVVIPAGETSAAVTVSVLGDTLDEPNETFTVQLIDPTHAVLATAVATGTILDDDDPPSISIDDVAVAETAGSATFTLTLTAVSGFDITVSYATSDVTALAGSDYSQASGQVTIPAGLTSATVSVAVTDDTFDEPDETFIVTLSDPVNVTLGDAAGVGTIIDDDPPPEVSIDDVSVVESAGPAVFTLRLSTASGREVRVSYASADATAAAGFDYTSVSGTAVFAAGTVEQTVSVAITDDTLDEPDETFTVTLSSPVNVTVADGEGVGTIVDDDAPPEVSIDDVTVEEGDFGTTNAVFTLTLSTESGFDVSVGYTTADVTAVAGSDYTAVSGVASIPSGSLTGTVTVPVTGDLIDELQESFTVELSDPQHVTVARAVGTGTIDDDDEALVTIDDVTVAEGDSGTTDAVFTVSLTTQADREIRVDYETVAATATEGDDYLATSGALVFPALTTELTVTVPVVGDLILEELEETFTVEVTSADTAVGDGSGLGTILDDEVCEGPNLLVNPSAEHRGADVKIPGWTHADGSDWQRRFGVPEPVDGRVTFFAGKSGYSELYQEVDVRAYATPIAAGEQVFAFEGFIRTYEEVPPDVVRIRLEYRDVSNAVVLDAYDSGDLMSPFEWTRLVDVRTAPVGTGWIRVSLLATRFTGEENDGFVDALSLRSHRAPTLSIDDVQVYEGGFQKGGGSHHDGTPELTDAVFTVSLACAWEHQVDVDYLTADGGSGLPAALAVEDYLTTSGHLTFPVGTTEQTLTVPVVGDEVDEPTESFVVDLYNAIAAGGLVVLDPQGEGIILDDDFCPRSHGYWKQHTDVWPVYWLELGGVEYEFEELLAFLEYKGRDASSHLALQLVAAKLDLARGSDPYILPIVEEADAFLAVYPPGSDPRGEDRDYGNWLKDQLDDYVNESCPEDDDGHGHGDDDDDGHGDDDDDGHDDGHGDDDDDDGHGNDGGQGNGNGHGNGHG